MLLAMAGCAIVDVVSKDLTNTLPVPEILILTCNLEALVFSIFAKILKEALYSKNMLSKNLPASSFCRHAGAIIFCVSLSAYSFIYGRVNPSGCSYSCQTGGCALAGSKCWMAPLDQNLRGVFWCTGYNATRL